MKIKDLKEGKVNVNGWVDNIRNLQYVIFLILRDSTGKIQITIEKEGNEELVKVVEDLTNESTIKVSGTFNKNDHVKLGGVEIIPDEIVITSRSLEELPINIKEKEASLREQRLDYRFLDLRREDNNKLFKIVAYLEESLREYWNSNDYTEIHTPKISASAAESGADMFKLDYFGKKAVLSQSPQFYKQMALASGFDRVFEIGDVYRAENSHTSYHASEITMLDAEIAWIEDYNDVMDELEKLIQYSFKKVKEKYGEDIKENFNIELNNFENKFPRINFSEAKKICKEKYNYKCEIENDLERKEEELLCKYALEEYNSDFIFITNYPYEARSFYVMKDEKGVTQTFDLLYRGVEITSGAQREHRPDILANQIKEKGIDPKLLDFYIEFFKYGCPPHGGFGIGLGRLIMKMVGLDNIREATFIYRGPTRLNP